MAPTTKKKTASHGLFWTLLKETPGYKDSYKEVIKEGVVHEHSNGKTCSLSEMYKKYPDLYSEMIEALKGNSYKRADRYDCVRDKAAKRVIASICGWLDKLGYTYPTASDKVRYAKAVACRASNCCDFNKIPESKLTAVYSLYCKKNSVEISNPALDYLVGKN